MSIAGLFADLKQQLDNECNSSIMKTVILWGREDLLGKAIESLLNTTHQWQVIKILGNHDARVLAREVEKANPEIVFINQGGCVDEFPIPIHLLQDFPDLRIITVNTENNLVEVYNRQKVWINKASDLLSIIDEHPNPSQKGGEE